MSIPAWIISYAPEIRIKQRAAVWAPAARQQVRHWLTFSPSLTWNVGRITALTIVSIVLHSWNLFNYPRYQGDEGVYMGAAWSLVHGSVTPYTYNYGHPPLGWALIALWCELTGGFFTFGTSVNTGRVLMVVLAAISGIFVYLIALRLSHHWQTAALATALFAYSPLSIDFQREVLLDNISIMWTLIALYLLIVGKGRLRYILGSAVVFAVAVLSKETLIVVFPAFAYAAWRSVPPFQRRYLTLVFCYVALGLASTFVLVAALKNELFPTGTLLGGMSPHVSLISTFLGQASRGGDQGSFLAQWRTWLSADGFLMLCGVASMGVNLYVYRKKPLIQATVLTGVLYFLFLARGGVTFAYYIIDLLPFLALSVALLADLAISKLIHAVGEDSITRSGRRAAPDVVSLAALLALMMITFYQVPLNHTNLTANGVAPEIEAMQWMSANAPRSSAVVASNYFWLDMRANGGMGDTYGATFQNVQMYWNVATDRAVLNGVFHDNWNNIDYVIEDSDMAFDADHFDMVIIKQAIAHSTVVATFQNTAFWVTIYEVQHVGPDATQGAARSNTITQVTSAPNQSLANAAAFTPH